MVLEKIQKENDIKKLTPQELALLKDEIRQFLKYLEKSSMLNPRFLTYPRMLFAS